MDGDTSEWAISGDGTIVAHDGLTPIRPVGNLNRMQSTEA